MEGENGLDERANYRSPPKPHLPEANRLFPLEQLKAKGNRLGKAAMGPGDGQWALIPVDTVEMPVVPPRLSAAAESPGSALPPLESAPRPCSPAFHSGFGRP